MKIYKHLYTTTYEAPPTRVQRWKTIILNIVPMNLVNSVRYDHRVWSHYIHVTQIEPK